ncbi:hypothetical protein [Paenibacillus sp. FSL M7-0896]|uniref:hypothetical protein n=1 Tax=Paenibacillus sp. FSL M7-0896 TaxID=2921610 RepID=UPI0030DB828C
MSDKVKLTKEEAAIVQSLLDEGRSSVEYTLKQQVFDPNQWSGKLLPLRKLSFDSLVRAFYIGYEVDETPEERLIMLVQHYEQRLKTATSSQEAEFFDGKLKGIREALSTLNIEIKWITE